MAPSPSSPPQFFNASAFEIPGTPPNPGTPVTPSAPSPVEGPGSSECVVCMETVVSGRVGAAQRACPPPADCCPSPGSGGLPALRPRLLLPDLQRRPADLPPLPQQHRPACPPLPQLEGAILHGCSSLFMHDGPARLILRRAAFSGSELSLY